LITYPQAQSNGGNDGSEWSETMSTGKKRKVAGGSLILAALATLATLTLGAGSASAQPAMGRAPWCVVRSDIGGMLQCSYHSFQQCMFAAQGVSNQCTANPWYEGPSRPRSRRSDPRAWR
jgi:hypothetical protein